MRFGGDSFLLDPRLISSSSGAPSVVGGLPGEEKRASGTLPLAVCPRVCPEFRFDWPFDGVGNCPGPDGEVPFGAAREGVVAPGDEYDPGIDGYGFVLPYP